MWEEENARKGDESERERETKHVVEFVDAAVDAGAQVATCQRRGNRDVVLSCGGSTGKGPGVGRLLGDVGKSGRDPQGGSTEEGKQAVSSKGLLLGVGLPVTIIAEPGVEIAEEDELCEGMPASCLLSEWICQSCM